MPGANALDVSSQVRAAMAELSYIPRRAASNTTPHRSSVVQYRSRGAIMPLKQLLVVLVVILSLQTWRASIIPLAKAGFHCGYVRAVADVRLFHQRQPVVSGWCSPSIVVDDAIVVGKTRNAMKRTKTERTKVSQRYHGRR